RSQPRAIRAARRAKLPVVRARRPAPGRRHPASASDVRHALTTFGKEIYYGVESVELVPAPSEPDRLTLGRFVAPGRILLYDQPASPWRLGFRLTPLERARLLDAGAEFDEEGVVAWPGETLKRVMLGHVLA